MKFDAIEVTYQIVFFPYEWVLRQGDEPKLTRVIGFVLSLLLFPLTLPIVMAIMMIDTCLEMYKDL